MVRQELWCGGLRYRCCWWGWCTKGFRLLLYKYVYLIKAFCLLPSVVASRTLNGSLLGLDPRDEYHSIINSANCVYVWKFYQKDVRIWVPTKVWKAFGESPAFIANLIEARLPSLTQTHPVSPSHPVSLLLTHLSQFHSISHSLTQLHPPTIYPSLPQLTQWQAHHRLPAHKE